MLNITVKVFIYEAPPSLLLTGKFCVFQEKRRNSGHTTTAFIQCSLVLLFTFDVFIRLSRLLHKQKFSEAEKFARQFNLDVEVKGKVVTQ